MNKLQSKPRPVARQVLRFGLLPAVAAPWARRLPGDRVLIGNIARSGSILLLGLTSALSSAKYAC